MGLSTKIISKMCLNIGIDFVFGLIPIIGDIFDIGWKANKRNVKLIEDNINKSDEKLFLNNLAVATLIITIIASFLLIIDKII